MSDIHESKSENRDPLTGAPGAHPVGVGVGGVAGGAAAGALAGSVLGPIGTLVGAAAGVIAGGAMGKGVAERIDPTAENEYWRNEYKERPYADASRDYDRDYATAYGLGLQARENSAGRTWDESEQDLRKQWDSARGDSTLEWAQAKGAVQDSWDRANRTYNAYEQGDDYFKTRFEQAPFRTKDDSFDDFGPAYRYGTQQRYAASDRSWDDTLENEFKEGWEAAKGNSRLTWERAKIAVKDAFGSDEDFGRKN
jgi:hypothetical protein